MSRYYDKLSQPDLSALISKNTFVTMYLINCFSNLVGLSEPLATVAGTTHRISQLRNLLKHKLSLRESQGGPVHGDDFSPFRDEMVPDVLLEVRHLNLSSPGQPSVSLVHDLCFQVRPNRSLLITGQSGCGKTTLLRTLKGLLEPRHGTYTFHTKNVLYLPQKTLLTDGTLRQQVLYPNEKQLCHIDDDSILRLLKEADLLPVVERAGGLNCDVDWDWYDCLSPGEAQRLCFVRLLCQKPTMAFLDEALSAVSQDLEERLYNLAVKMNITLVSVGHRQSLLRYHRRKLYLHNQTWTIEEIP